MILDQIERSIRDHTWFDIEEKYVANTLWVAGSYFLEYQDIKVFNAFPMVAFMSPEPDSGKSRALKITELLSYNALTAGKYTPALLLAKIDRNKGKICTICLDEMDTIFSYGKDNSELILLFNLGYERGAIIGRMKRFADGEVETPAYCPKAFAGLRIAKIPGPTKTRSIVINMQPRPNDQFVLEDIDTQKAKKLNEGFVAWAANPETQEKLRTVDLSGPETSFLSNRDRQLWKPLLAIAKISSDEWYRRALKAARYFVEGQQTEKSVSHRILLGAYHIFRTGDYPDRIHSIALLERLHELGIPRWVDQNLLAEHLSSYDPEIRTRQMKVDDVNRHGYDWHTFEKSFRIYITVAEVAEVAPFGGAPLPSSSPMEILQTPLPALPALPTPLEKGATGATTETNSTVGGNSLPSPLPSKPISIEMLDDFVKDKDWTYEEYQKQRRQLQW